MIKNFNSPFLSFFVILTVGGMAPFFLVMRQRSCGIGVDGVMDASLCTCKVDRTPAPHVKIPKCKLE